MEVNHFTSKDSGIQPGRHGDKCIIERKRTFPNLYQFGVLLVSSSEGLSLLCQHKLKNNVVLGTQSNTNNMKQY